MLTRPDEREWLAKHEDAAPIGSALDLSAEHRERFDVHSAWHLNDRGALFKTLTSTGDLGNRYRYWTDK